MPTSTSSTTRQLVALLALFCAVFCLSVASPAAHAQWQTQIVFDNDVFVGRDQDYTAGFSFAFDNESLRKSPLLLRGPLDFIDTHLLNPQGPAQGDYYGLELGLYGFTPEDIERVPPNHDDRPYASLLYWANTHGRIDYANDEVWESTLVIGALGLDWFDSIQNAVHSADNMTPAKGWGNQISAGGELTLRYRLAHSQGFDFDSDAIQAQFTQQYSVGYLSEATYSLSARFGDLRSTWWAFRPELTTYGEEHALPSAQSGEHFFFGGAAVRLRAYNAFMQGQFRSSDVTYSSNELNHALVEAWLGYAQVFPSGWQFSFSLRGQSSEVKEGEGDRDLLWGGLIVSKAWD